MGETCCSLTRKATSTRFFIRLNTDVAIASHFSLIFHTYLCRGIANCSRRLRSWDDDLIALHLLEAPQLQDLTNGYVGPVNPEVVKVSYSKSTVWLDKGQTYGFRTVSEDVWTFQVGGYQVCEKWLKERKGRTLSKKEIGALSEDHCCSGRNSADDEEDRSSH